MKIKTIFQQFMISSAAVALLGVAPVATADDILHTTGYANGSQNFGLVYPTNVATSANAGGFTGTWNGDAIIFWCIQLDESFGFGQNYTDYVASLAPNTPTYNLLDDLFETAYATALDSTSNSAAFQLAIWEIIYDPTSLNISSGGFRVTSGNATTRTAAQTLLNNLASASTNNYDLVLLLSVGPDGKKGHQDFVTTDDSFRYLVPEPNGLWLILVAFAAMFAVSRRRSRVTA